MKHEKESKKVTPVADIVEKQKSAALVVTEHAFPKGKKVEVEGLPFVVHESNGRDVVLRRTDIL